VRQLAQLRGQLHMEERARGASARLNHEELYRNVRDALFKSGHGITPREAQVCASIVVGGNVLNISRTLGISTHTVATHRKRAYSKFGIRSQNELFALYFEAIRLPPLSPHDGRP
jgi:DNA-binding CsgD family transcriptional regulator